MRFTSNPASWQYFSVPESLSQFCFPLSVFIRVPPIRIDSRLVFCNQLRPSKEVWVPMARKLLFINVAAALVVAVTGPSAWAWAEGSVITWGTPTNISGDSDVRTDGTLVAAFNMNGPAVTCDGHATRGLANARLHCLSAIYQSLLSTAISTDDNNTLTLTTSGLIL